MKNHTKYEEHEEQPMKQQKTIKIIGENSK